jgi:outer membrane protein assembly factor BamD (BamD/ComL family)
MASANREAFVNAVADLKQPLFLSRLIEFLTNETDLGVADRLTIAISDLTKTDFHPHDYGQITEWWRSHEDEYTNWPFAHLDRGMQEMSTGDFSKAAKSFEQVLIVDPSADMSRAFAIASFLALEKTDEATEIAKGFKDPTKRWAKWSGAVIELYTGSASNATVQFAELAKSNPTMSILPQQSSYYWRKIDWPVYLRLTSTEKTSP